MIFNTWDERKDFLLELGAAVNTKFNENTFNVFVFGSFLRNDYKPLKSDIDLAIYSEDFKIARKVYNFIADYLDNYNIPHSLLMIDTAHTYDYVALQAVLEDVTFTDYFPESLKIFRIQSYLRMLWENEERRWLQEKFGKLEE